MILELGEDENSKDMNEDFTITTAPDSDVKVYERGIIDQSDYSVEVTSTKSQNINYA